MDKMNKHNKTSLSSYINEEYISGSVTKKLFGTSPSGDEVVGLDNINDYYDVNLKYGRLKELGISVIPDSDRESTNLLIDNFNYKPDTKLSEGIGEFVKWYKEFYK